MVVSPTPPKNNSSDNPRYDETVTLTKTQLRAILESVSNSRGSTGERLRHHSTPTFENGHQTPLDQNVNPHYPESVSSLTKSDTRPSTSVQDVPLYLSERTYASPTLRSSSRLEQKRLQWEKEKAEMQEWNPWGRPGAGAPLRAHSISLRPYSQLVLNNSSDHLPYSTSPTPVYMDAHSPDDVSPYSRVISGTDLNLKITGQNQLMQPGSPLTSARTVEESWSSPSRNFTRGHGFALDAGTYSQQQEKRLRALEYQREIERQVEEKKRRQKEEKEKLAQYDVEQEKKLAEERARIQEEFEAEQEKQKQKEEQKNKTSEMLFLAVEEAKKEAEAAKKMRKLKKLNLQANTTAAEEKASQKQYKKEEIRTEKVFLHSPEMITEHVSLPYSQSPTNLSQKEFSTQASLESSDESNYSGYTENRVLTPSKMRRIRPDMSPSKKNFGTQTDKCLLIGTWVNDESSPSDNLESIHSSQPTIIKRVQYSKPTKALAAHVEPKHKSDSKLYKHKKLQELRKQHWEHDVALSHSNSVIAPPRAPFSTPRPMSNITNSYSPSLPLDLESAQIRVPSRPGSPPVPALQKKLGMVLPSPRPSPSLDFTSPYNARPPPFERGRHSPPVPALRKSLDNSSTKPQMRASSSEHLPALPSQDQRLFSLPSNFINNSNVNNINNINNYQSSASSSSSSARSVNSNLSLRRRWHSQESFEPDLPLNDDGTSLGRRQSRKKWTTQKETFDHLHTSSLEDKSANVPVTTPPANPEILLGKPTKRQDRILQSLSDLRKGLTQKQKEFENLLHAV